MRGIHSTARSRAFAAALVVLGAAAGCQTGGPRRVATAEPGLGGDGAAVVENTTPAGNQVSWVDRHPLFYKPREYYDSSGKNTIVKTASATLIGIPVGFVGEIRQIVTGSPTRPKY